MAKQTSAPAANARAPEMGGPRVGNQPPGQMLDEGFMWVMVVTPLSFAGTVLLLFLTMY